MLTHKTRELLLNDYSGATSTRNATTSTTLTAEPEQLKLPRDGELPLK